MKVFYVMLVAIVFATSCNPLRHYQKVATDTEVTQKKKAVIAPWVSINFPVTETFIKGKDSIVVDSSYNKEIVDSLEAQLDLLLSSKTDSINVDSIKKVIIAACKPVTITKTVTRVDTVVKKDNAAMYSLQQQITKLEANEVLQETKYNDAKEQLKKAQKDKRQYIMYIIILSVALFAVCALYIKKVFT
jgi:hypothetical protein